MPKCSRNASPTRCGGWPDGGANADIHAWLAEIHRQKSAREYRSCAECGRCRNARVVEIVLRLRTCQRRNEAGECACGEKFSVCTRGSCASTRHRIPPGLSLHLRLLDRTQRQRRGFSRVRQRRLIILCRDRRLRGRQRGFGRHPAIAEMRRLRFHLAAAAERRWLPACVAACAETTAGNRRAAGPARSEQPRGSRSWSHVIVSRSWPRSRPCDRDAVAHVREEIFEVAIGRVLRRQRHRTHLRAAGRQPPVDRAHAAPVRAIDRKRRQNAQRRAQGCQPRMRWPAASTWQLAQEKLSWPRRE